MTAVPSQDELKNLPPANPIESLNTPPVLPATRPNRLHWQDGEPGSGSIVNLHDGH